MIPIFFSKYLIPLKPFCYWIRKKSYLFCSIIRKDSVLFSHWTCGPAWVQSLFYTVFIANIFQYFNRINYSEVVIDLISLWLLMSIESQYKQLNTEIQHSLIYQRHNLSLNPSHWLVPVNPDRHLMTKIMILNNFTVTWSSVFNDGQYWSHSTFTYWMNIISIGISIKLCKTHCYTISFTDRYYQVQPHHLYHIK